MHPDARRTGSSTERRRESYYHNYHLPHSHGQLQLETRLTIAQARTAHTTARLLTALDTLDALRAQHADAVETMRHEAELLQSKVRRYARAMERAQKERDEMVEMVQAVVEKGACGLAEKLSA